MRRLVLTATLAAAFVAVAGAGGASFAEIDVSQLRGSQAEVAIAADPSNPSVLLAASNSIDFRTLAALGNLMRTYTSTDGGATWKTASGPTATAYSGRKRCNSGDPAPLIDATGREYLAFLAAQCVTLQSILSTPDEFDIARVEVATRADPASPWQVNQVFPVRSARFDDKPAIAVDAGANSPHAGRVYVAWTRITPGRRKHDEPTLLIVLSHSDDHGVTWTKPVVVPDARAEQTTFAGLAVDASGTVFVSWSDVDHRLLIDRSTDGGDHFGTDVVALRPALPAFACQQPGSFRLPAQTKRCLTSTPMLAVDSRPGVVEHVYLIYSAPDAAGNAQDVAVRTFDQALAPIGSAHPVHPVDSGRDEFMSASALDDAGRLWVCYYDTGADRTRQTARYTCTASADGGITFAAPRAIASVASNETKAPALSFQYGDYEGIAVAGGVAHPIWTDSRNLRASGEEIYTSTLTAADLQLP
ncbi:MAG: hypothetical protein ACJ76I_07600 [Gaiellaceae bacterium]